MYVNCKPGKTNLLSKFFCFSVISIQRYREFPKGNESDESVVLGHSLWSASQRKGLNAVRREITRYPAIRNERRDVAYLLRSVIGPSAVHSNLHEIQKCVRSTTTRLLDRRVTGECLAKSARSTRDHRNHAFHRFFCGGSPTIEQRRPLLVGTRDASRKDEEQRERTNERGDFAGERQGVRDRKEREARTAVASRLNVSSHRRTGRTAPTGGGRGREVVACNLDHATSTPAPPWLQQRDSSSHRTPHSGSSKNSNVPWPVYGLRTWRFLLFLSFSFFFRPSS